MKYLAILLSVFFISNAFAQTNKVQTLATADAPTNSLKDRLECPPVKTKKEFNVREKRGESFLVMTTQFDKNGNILKETDFDFFGSGKEVGTLVNTYKDGKLMSKVVKSNDQTTNYSYEYNDQGLKSKETWSRKNGQGAITTFEYNDDGKIEEEKHLNLKGVHDFSRVYKYSKDVKDDVLFEEKWEVYTDGSANLLQYQRATAFENGKAVKQVYVTEDGTPTRLEEYTYNDQGLRTVVVDWSPGSTIKEVMTYNEYSEPVESKTYSILEDETERLDVHSTTTFNKYGQKTEYTYLQGSTDTYKIQYEYEYYNK